jgi:hypothetical protein
MIISLLFVAVAATLLVSLWSPFWAFMVALCSGIAYLVAMLWPKRGGVC